MTKPESVTVVCGQCGQVNRVPQQRLGDRPVCGKCQQLLLPDKPVELTGATFSKFISRNDLPVVVDFWAPWCGPCRMMAPEFAKAAQSLSPHVILAKLNTESDPQAAAPFGITGIPTMILFQGGREIARQSGAMNAAQIQQWIRSSR